MSKDLEKMVEEEISKLKKAQDELQKNFMAAGYQIGILEHILKEYRKDDKKDAEVQPKVE